MQTNLTLSNSSVPDRSNHATAAHDLRVPRAAAVVALGGVALIHLLELQGKLEEVRYLGIGYVGLIIGCVVAAAMLVHRNSRTGWIWPEFWP